MNDKILFVDDEQNLLDGIKRDLYDSYDITTTLSGKEALKILKTEGPYAVVVSDMRMPIMDGATFLALVKESYPESIRIMLTGNTDLGTAIAAVNEGNIFRFINKPCSTETLERVLNAAIKQYHLIHAEKELLENTFQGAINVLVDILALTNPVAFSRAKRIKYFTGKIARFLELEDIWKYEVAAILSQLGCVTIPPVTLEKVYLNQNLDSNELEMLKQYPIIGHDLIVNIPRLEVVAKMITNQQNDLEKSNYINKIEKIPLDVLGAAILRISIDYDTLLSQGLTRGKVLLKLNSNAKQYHPQLLLAIKKIIPPVIEKKVLMVPVKKLSRGMILESDIITKKGVLLAKKGQEITPTMHIMFENYMNQKNIDENILVAVPIDL